MEETTTDKSWRNCELVIYPEQMKKMQETLESGWVPKWAWILHNKDLKTDGTPKEIHVHLMCSWLKKTTKTSVICNKFDIRENQIEKIKGGWGDALDYLTHGNAPDKYQYDESEVHANFDWKTDAQDSKRNKQKRLDEVIEKIGSGEIREYNLTEYITVSEYTKNRRTIESAFKWRKSYVLAHLEEMVKVKNIVWIFGQTGTGKTTFAKELAKSAGFFYSLTSTGRNMFDEYRDEPCLIIDDLRPNDMRFSDLLGILDPYNFKAAQARYSNKALQTQMIIVTTTMSPELYCQSCNGDALNAEDERQLYRRINSVYEVTKTTIYEYLYNNSYTERIQGDQWPNAFLVVKQQRENKERNKELVNKTIATLLG